MAPQVLAEGGYLARKEPVIFIGDTGTGKSHLAVGLAVAACPQQKRVRFTTAAERTGIIVTTNLPFSMVDRLTDQAHIIDTGDESYRFLRTMANKKKGGKA